MKVYNVYLDDDESEALRALSRRELRDPRAQAALLIRKALKRQGLVTSDKRNPAAQLTGKERAHG